MAFLARNIVVAAAFLTASAFAQINTARTMGMLQDATGGGIPGVAVRAVTQETGVATATLSRDAGDYLLNFLVPGNYRVEAERNGFRRAAQIDVTVNAGGIAHLDF